MWNLCVLLDGLDVSLLALEPRSYGQPGNSSNTVKKHVDVSRTAKQKSQHSTWIVLTFPPISSALLFLEESDIVTCLVHFLFFTLFVVVVTFLKGQR